MNLVCFNIQIRRDNEGRYCLNDLHKAAILSGANERTKEPGKFMASPQTIELVGEIETTQNLGSLPVNKIEGRNGGTYVCKELVYAYAMWISAKFHLHVIQTFDKFVISEQVRIAERQAAQLEFPDMTQALLEHRTEIGKQTKFFHYSNECDLINKIVTGYTAKKLREKLGIEENEALRDYLTESQISAIHYLQRTNTVLIEEGYSFEERKQKLTERFERKFAAKVKAEFDKKLMLDM